MDCIPTQRKWKIQRKYSINILNNLRIYRKLPNGKYFIQEEAVVILF